MGTDPTIEAYPAAKGNTMNRHVLNPSHKTRQQVAQMKAYHAALELFFQGQRAEAMESIAAAVEEERGDRNQLALYRLWIEILAEESDWASLRALNKHLSTMSRLLDHGGEWLALRALIHLELDEMEACALMVRALRQEEDPYALEFVQKYDLRFADDGEAQVVLSDSLHSVTDYQHIQTLCQGLLLSGRIEELGKVLDYSQELYPRAPLAALYRTYQHLDHNQLEGASKQCANLRPLNTDNLEWILLQAYIQFCRHDYNATMKGLNRALDLTRGQDPDVLSLLAYCHHLLAADQPSSPHWKHALKCYLKAQQVRTKLGLPSTDLALLIAKMKAFQGDLAGVEMMAHGFWILDLPPKDAMQFRQSKAADSEYLLHTLSHRSHKHDLVVVTATQPGQNEFRVLALYKVVTDPAWHPQFSVQSTLELVTRFSEPLCLPNALRANVHHEAPGVFRTDEGGFVELMGAVRNQMGGAVTIDWDAVSKDKKVGA